MPHGNDLIEELVRTETDLYKEALARYGAYYDYALFSNTLFANAIENLTHEHVGTLFGTMFFGQCFRAQLLGILSIVRLHRNQALQNFRVMVESGPAFLFAFQLPEDEANKYLGAAGKRDILTSADFRKDAYEWLKSHHPSSNTFLHSLKKTLNSSTMHATPAAASANFCYTSGQTGLTLGLVDNDTLAFLPINKLILLSLSRAAQSLLFVLYQEGYSSITLKTGVHRELTELAVANEKLREQLSKELDETDQLIAKQHPVCEEILTAALKTPPGL